MAAKGCSQHGAHGGVLTWGRCQGGLGPPLHRKHRGPPTCHQPWPRPPGPLRQYPQPQNYLSLASAWKGASREAGSLSAGHKSHV